jgi:hypothetical protein
MKRARRTRAQMDEAYTKKHPEPTSFSISYSLSDDRVMARHFSSRFHCQDGKISLEFMEAIGDDYESLNDRMLLWFFQWHNLNVEFYRWQMVHKTENNKASSNDIDKYRDALVVLEKIEEIGQKRNLELKRYTEFK